MCNAVAWAKKPGLASQWRMLGRRRPCCKMAVMLPWGPVSVDVNCFRGSRGGTSGRRWYGASGLVDQTGNVDAVVRKGVVGISGVIPLHMGELAEICQVFEGEADVGEKLCDVEVLWCVFRSQHTILSFSERLQKCGGGCFQGGWGRRSAGMLGKGAWDMLVSWLGGVDC